MAGDVLWFSCVEHADRFAKALADDGHQSEQEFDGDFSLEGGWRYGVAYTAPEVTQFSQTPYSPAGRRASRFCS